MKYCDQRETACENLLMCNGLKELKNSLRTLGGFWRSGLSAARFSLGFGASVFFDACTFVKIDLVLFTGGFQFQPADTC